MTSNLYTFSSQPTLDNLVIYTWCLSIFISVWVISALIVNFYFNSETSFRSFWRVSFDGIESFLIVLSSILIITIITLNLIVVRSHSPWYYNSDSQNVIENSIAIVGRQWYWVYNLLQSDVENSFDSYITSLVDCVDNALNLKTNKIYSLNITSADVLHSFALPSAQIKSDAVPGRINNIYLLTNVPGRHVGYCSEFCGAGHSYMPIVVNVF
uniref:cytochrome-c oxidase n=1 Tax=Pseudochauhanea macrorchis TaxID=1086615 RepID=H6U4S2_PSEMH|nr:cytochrome c oxidase subunit II [Pseudochauhanea macrorchis]AEO93258.1 cytochrome c oxidase subunit II [Pseudochauhanea macrorchis]